MISIFISYCHEDNRWLEEESPFGLISWLARSLQDHAVFWFDRTGIVAGDDFQQRIEEEIQRANIALLLVSQAFLNSQFIRSVELPRIIERANNGELIVIPLLLEPCFWFEHDFLASRHLLPGKPTPLIEYCDSDVAWKNVRFEILRSLRDHVFKLALTPLPPSPNTGRGDALTPLPPSPNAERGERDNLPNPITSFVGREHDLQRLAMLLVEPSTRLITIIGPGGIGKTRLAIEVAQRHIDRYRDGVWFLDLRGAREGSEIPSIIAETLHIPLSADRSMLDQVLTALGERQMMLICDNCEQIADPAPVLTSLLRQAPHVTLMVTSRSPLYIKGERLYDIKPLPLPADGDDHDLQCESIILFEQRASDTCDGWKLTPDNTGVVSEICTRLDGIPLCIELAAARIRNMTPREILTGLTNRFRLLTSGSKDPRDCHRTLRDLIDWSYNLLQEDHRAFFARLAIFPGGFFSESVETVMQDPLAHDTLIALCDASLITRSVWHEQTRFEWLESIRKYAEEKLMTIESDELVVLHRRHAEYYFEIAQSRSSQFRSPTEGDAIGELSLEFTNFRAAFDWSRQNDPGLCAQYSMALYELMVRRGHWDDAMAWSESGLQAARQLNDAAVEGILLLNVASTSYDRGLLDSTSEHAEQSLAFLRQAADPAGEARALNLIGLIQFERGDNTSATDWLEQSLAICIREKSQALEGIILHNLGVVAQYQQDTSAALAYYHQALAIRQHMGDQRGIAETRNNIGVLALDQNDYSAAALSFNDCLQASQSLENEFGTALALHNLGEVAAKCDYLDCALPLLTMAGHIFRRIGSSLAPISEAFTASLRNRCEPGHFDEQLAMAKAMPFSQVSVLAKNVVSLVNDKLAGS